MFNKKETKERKPQNQEYKYKTKLTDLKPYQHFIHLSNLSEEEIEYIVLPVSVPDLTLEIQFDNENRCLVWNVTDGNFDSFNRCTTTEVWTYEDIGNMWELDVNVTDIENKRVSVVAARRKIPWVPGDDIKYYYIHDTALDDITDKWEIILKIWNLHKASIAPKEDTDKIIKNIQELGARELNRLEALETQE